MTSTEQTQFVHNYSKVLVQAWTDPVYMNTLKTDPVAALRHFGIVTPPGATVNVAPGDTNRANIQQQIDAWDQGATTNTYTLYVPDAPQLGVHAGTGGIGALDTSYCCCCCPCCTCT